VVTAAVAEAVAIFLPLVPGLEQKVPFIEWATALSKHFS